MDASLPALQASVIPKLQDVFPLQLCGDHHPDSNLLAKLD